MKGDIMLRVLEKIGEVPVLLGDLMTITTSPYGSSMGQIQRRLSEPRENREKAQASTERKKRLYNTLHILYAQDLVVREKKEAGIFLKLTARGKEKLEELRLRKKKTLPIPRYVPGKGRELKIFIFDIPEIERRKRDWLRAVLKRLNFRMIQKSVWVGKSSIPDDFIKDIDNMRLLSHIKILAVTKTGNLESVV